MNEYTAYGTNSIYEESMSKYWEDVKENQVIDPSEYDEYRFSEDEEE